MSLSKVITAWFIWPCDIFNGSSPTELRWQLGTSHEVGGLCGKAMAVWQLMAAVLVSLAATLKAFLGSKKAAKLPSWPRPCQATQLSLGMKATSALTQEMKDYKYLFFLSPKNCLKV